MQKPVFDTELLEWAESPQALSASPSESKQSIGYGVGPENLGEAPYYQHVNRIFQNLLRRSKELLFYANKRDEILGSQTAVEDKNQRATLYFTGSEFKNAAGLIQAMSGSKELLVQELTLSGQALDLSGLETKWQMEGLEAVVELAGQNLILGPSSGEIRLSNLDANPSQLILKGRCNGLRILTTTANLTVVDSDPSFSGSYFLDGVLSTHSGLTGMVAPFMMATAPAGWLECNGQAISRTTYANLFNAIGTAYGVGDGSSTFAIPDLRGYVLRGYDHGAGQDPDAASRTDRGDGTTGDVVGSKQQDSMQGHRHKFYSDGLRDSLGMVSSSGTDTGTFHGGATMGSYTSMFIVDPSDDGVNGVPRTASETRMKNVAVLYCIKI